MPATREEAVAYLDIWADGTGDPIRTDPGFNLYHSYDKDTVENNMLVSYAASGISLGQYLDDVGISGRPFLVPKDTVIADFLLTPLAKWENRKPVGGTYDTSRIWMSDGSTGTTAWSALSNYVMPANSSFAISVIMEDTAADWWDIVGQQPYFRFEFAGGAYAIYWEKHRGTHLLRRNLAGGWDYAKKLSNFQRMGDLDELFLWIRWQRGRIGISMDFGDDYTWYGDDENPVTLYAGKIGFYGAGYSVGLGVHQLDYSPFIVRPLEGWRTYWPRVSSPVIDGHYDAIPGAGVAFYDRGNTGSQLANYEVLVTPGTLGNYPFAVKACPALYATQLEYPTARNITANATTNELDPYIEAADIDKPRSLSGARATVQFNMAVADVLSGNWKYRKVRIRLGYRMSDGTHEIVDSFTGYVANITEDWAEGSESGYRRKVVVMEIANATEWLRRSRWEEFDSIPLGGLLPNEACDRILKSLGLMDWAGLDTSYRSWDLSGWLEAYRLPIGKFEDRHEMIKPEEERWTTLSRIQGTVGCEAGADDAGVYFSVPINHVDPTPSWTFRATSQGATDLREKVKRITSVRDFTENCTAVMVLGKLRNGYRAMAYSIDTAAETIVASGRFSRWRETLRVELDGTVSPDILANTNVMLSQYNFGTHKTADLSVPIHPGLYRHQRIQFAGFSGIDIPDAVDHGIRTIRHSYRKDHMRGWSTLDTAIGVWRI